MCSWLCWRICWYVGELMCWWLVLICWCVDVFWSGSYPTHYPSVTHPPVLPRTHTHLTHSLPKFENAILFAFLFYHPHQLFNICWGGYLRWDENKSKPCAVQISKSWKRLDLSWTCGVSRLSRTDPRLVMISACCLLLELVTVICLPFWLKTTFLGWAREFSIFHDHFALQHISSHPHTLCVPSEWVQYNELTGHLYHRAAEISQQLRLSPVCLPKVTKCSLCCESGIILKKRTVNEKIDWRLCAGCSGNETSREWILAMRQSKNWTLQHLIHTWYVWIRTRNNHHQPETIVFSSANTRTQCHTHHDPNHTSSRTYLVGTNCEKC